jgi:hypothetical protein
MRIGHVIERRRRDRSIAWGVSPRNTVQKKPTSREAATDIFTIMAAAHAAAAICRPFRAVHFPGSSILGLTPQAMNMPPLRGSLNPSNRE